MNTIKNVLIIGKNYLKENNIECYCLDAEIILMYVLKIDKIKLLTTLDTISLDDEKYFFELLKIRTTNKPISYITNHINFMGYGFYVNENVLIPRPDTEILVEIAINVIKKNNFSTLLDVCTGSGVIPISIALETNIKALAIDISKDALDVANINNANHCTTSLINFICSDLFSNVPNIKFDVITSNPPYISKDDMENLMSDVKDFEPNIALYGGEDGLYFYREIIKNSFSYLNNKGFLILEIGYNQGVDVKNLLNINGFVDIQIIKDYNNLDRVVYGQFIEKRCNYVY